MAYDHNEGAVVRQAWVEPVILELNVAETRHVNHLGHDGDVHADSTRS